MARIHRYEPLGSDPQVADYYAKDYAGGFITYRFKRSVNDELRDEHERVGPGGEVSRAWLKEFERNGLRIPTTGDFTLDSFDVPDHVLSLAELNDAYELRKSENVRGYVLIRGQFNSRCSTPLQFIRLPGA